MDHKFHIPVLGLGYSIDTPLKVARYGISSVVSVVDDELTERMREYHAKENGEPFVHISKTDVNHREKRITAYLNLLDKLIEKQFEQLKSEPFEPGNDICRYFDLLPETSGLKHGFELMMDYPEGESKRLFATRVREQMTRGAIDVNIMSKIDKLNYDVSHESTGE